MRGSPLLRFILLVLFLTGVAVGVRRVTSSKAMVEPAPTEAQISPAPDVSTVPFRLLLSAAADIVVIETGKIVRPDVKQNPISGILSLDLANPHLSLIVRWKNPPTPNEHRFARLTLEPPGQETFVHVFDAEADIDDFLELPLPAAP